MNPAPTRRQWLAASTALGTGLAFSTESAVAHDESVKRSFGYCLNFSTIRSKNLDVVKKIEIAAKAGYQGIEPWMREIDDYVKQGNTLKDLGKRIKDAGLTVESAIGFAKWIVDDDAQRKKALEQAKTDMETVRAIGGKRLAAPPTGATGQRDMDLRKAAERYRALLKIGDQIGVVPQVEVWGFSKTLSRLSEAVFVAVESGHPKACLLPDIYHLYKGGNSFDSLGLLSGQAIQVFHVNDYPAVPGRDKIGDADRVHVGDGIAPVKQIFKSLHQSGFRGMLSLELFNRTYWKQDPLDVARTGLKKIQAAVKSALES